MSGFRITPGQPGGDSDAAIYTQMLGALASMSGDDTFLSPYHFTVVKFSTTELDFSGGFPTIFDVTQFGAILQRATDGSITIYFPHTSVFAWDGVNDRLAVTGANFADTDKFQVIIRGGDRATSLPEDARKMIDVAPYPLRSDDAGIPLITSPQDFTAAWVDLGPEIPMYGWNTCGFYFTFDKNNAVNMRVRVLDKHESGGVEEYPSVIETYGTAVIAVEPAYWELTQDVDQLLPLTIKTNGLVPYVQVQIQAGTPGATPGQIDAAYYMRGWR